MKAFLIVIIVITLITLFIGLGYIFRLLLDKRTRNNCGILVEYTRQFTKEKLGLIRIVSGPVRAGKSTMSSGLIHLDELNILDSIEDDINDVKEILHELNFVDIDNDIIEQYNIHKDRFLTKKFLLKKYETILKGQYYDNHLKVFDYSSLLDKYIYAIFRKLDGNYVLSNIKKYSHITQSSARTFKSDYMKIRDNKKSPILRYMTVFEDEKLLSEKVSNNTKANFLDDGTSTYLRLIGQIGEEKIFYTTTAQNALRWVKSEREIATSIIYINSKEVIGNLPTLTKRLKRKKERNLKKMIRYAKRKFKDQTEKDHYLNNDNEFKKKNMVIKDKLNKIFSESYIQYCCTIYRKIDDIGKATKDVNNALKFDFVFPLKWCYGSIDTHYFSFIQDYLENYTKSSYYDEPDKTTLDFKSLAKSILSKPDKPKKESKKGSDKNVQKN